MELLAEMQQKGMVLNAIKFDSADSRQGHAATSCTIRRQVSGIGPRASRMVASHDVVVCGHSPSAERAGRMPGQVHTCPWGRRVQGQSHGGCRGHGSRACRMVAGLSMARSGHSPSAERAGRMPGQVRACPGGRRVFRVGPSMARSGHGPSAAHAGGMPGQVPRAHGADACTSRSF